MDWKRRGFCWTLWLKRSHRGSRGWSADEKFDLSSTKLDAVLSLFMRQRRCVTAVDGKNDVTPLEFPFCRTVRKYLGKIGRRIENREIPIVEL